MNTDPTQERTASPGTPTSLDYREMIRLLTEVYQDAGLPRALARQAAEADLECSSASVALLA